MSKSIFLVFSSILRFLKSQTMNKLLIVFAVFAMYGFTGAKDRKMPSKETFSNPTIEYYPKPLWFWNNTTVTGEGISHQMQDFRDSCYYGGFGILPFGKKFKPEYLSDEYFKMYGVALEKAKELGLTMCLYDEYGFPSGGVGPHNGDGIGRFEKAFPIQTIKRLDKIEIEVSGLSVCNQIVPGGNLMAAVAMEKQSFKRINLRGFITDGVLKWEVPAGEWKVMFFVCIKDGDPIVDYLDPEAVRNFITMTHEAYYSRFKRYFGTVITGTFFDEPTMYRANGRMWTDRFNEKFEKQYGFNPEIYYPALWYNIGLETSSARNFLFGFRTELYAKGFTKELNDWSAAHSVPATGHQDQEEILNPVSVSGDLMKCFKYLDIPGIDKIGGDRPAERFYKLVSSAAYNWNKSFVMSETYGAMGNISWNEIFSVAMDQYAKGINILIPHAVWYDTNNVTYKPELSHRNVLYADSLKIFNQFLARLNMVLQKKGKHIADIAVLYPIQSLQGEHYFDGPLPFYKGGVEIPKTDYIDVANWLTEDAGKDYTFLHPEVLDEKCIVSGAKLQFQNSVNSDEYSVLIIPSCKTISLSNLKKIKYFNDKGGNIIFTSQLPVYSVEPGKDSEVTEMVNSILSETNQNGNKTNQASGKAIFISNPNGKAIREAIEKLDLRFDVEYPINKDLRYIHKIINGMDVYYFANVGRSNIATTIQFRGNHNPDIWNPHTGEVTKTGAATNIVNGFKITTLPLNLKSNHSIFYISKQSKLNN